MMKFNMRGLTIASLAFAALALGSAPSYAGVDNLGLRTSKVADSDQVTRKEVVATSAPTAGASGVTTVETVTYLHKSFWFWQNDQAYAIKYNGTAEYVGRLDYWMLKDVEGSFYRFNKGSTVGVETAKPIVDIGAQAAPLAANDSAYVSATSAGNVSADGSSRVLNVTYSYTHVETYDNVTYTVSSSPVAVLVPLQNAHMTWVGNTLYRIDMAGNVQALREKPTVNVGVKNSPLGANDQQISWRPAVSAGRVSFDGRSRDFILSRDFVHEESYQKLQYTMQESVAAPLVIEQNSYMQWIGQDLYRVRVGSNTPELLVNKPVSNIGYRAYKLDSLDPLVSVLVTPTSLTSDNKSIFVNVRRIYRHTETFQVKEYYGESTEIARYNDTYKLWTVIVDGRIYVIAYDGDVVNDGSVVVVHAPPSMHRPDVIVVKPNGEDPPVVVPTKKRPPVVDNNDNDPPVVVPNKRKPPVVVDGDDDGPAVVVPRR